MSGITLSGDGAEAWVGFGRRQLQRMRIEGQRSGRQIIKRVMQVTSDVTVTVEYRRIAGVDCSYIDIVVKSGYPKGIYLPSDVPYEVRTSDEFLSYGNATGPLPNAGGVITARTVEILVNGAVVESYTGTWNVFDQFFVDHTQGTQTFSNFPDASGGYINGVIFSSTAGGSFNTAVSSPIPGWSVAAAAVLRTAQFANLASYVAGAAIPASWKVVIKAARPVAKFKKVEFILFGPVVGGVAYGPYPADPGSLTITEMELYGTFVFSYDPDTDVFTRVGWEPSSPGVPYIRIVSPGVADPTQAWPGYNTVAVYSPAPGAAEKRKNIKDPASGEYDPYMATILDTVGA